MKPACPSRHDALAELDRIAPEAPLLALGQTVFWDEPMKAGVALAAQREGSGRRFIAGVHDTDYFAKLPSARGTARYQVFPHNDTTTKGLWSAAAEFSTLFGSETVVTREMLQSAGVNLAKVARRRPEALDQATEAWGWRGIALTGSDPKVTAETTLGPLFPILYQTLQDAVHSSLDVLAGDHRDDQAAAAERLLQLACDAAEDRSISLAAYYRSMLPRLLELVAAEPVDVETTTTTELLLFNSTTCGLPRFEILDLFLDPASRHVSRDAYDGAVRGSEMYTLDRFGSWAIPFDLVVPGHGRGTLRIAPKAIIVMTPKPLFITLKKPIGSVADLAAAIERKLGPDCVVVGKALTLIGMLAREHVFVFHEGASSYVHRSRTMHRLLADSGFTLALNPILRVRYEPWEALRTCCAWLKLPEPFCQPFGVDELCAPSFAARWHEVAADQRALLETLGTLKRPLDFIRFLSESIGQSWIALAREYEAIHARLEQLDHAIAVVKAEKREIAERLRDAKRRRVEVEVAKGAHWRAKIFEKDPDPDALRDREELADRVEEIIAQIQHLKRDWQARQEHQEALVSDPEVLDAHERRRNIELELDLKRMRLARQAVISSLGLDKAGHRPAAWWFALVCPDGTWFRETLRTARFYLEPLR